MCRLYSCSNWSLILKGIIGAEVDSRVLRKICGLTQSQVRVLEEPTYQERHIIIIIIIIIIIRYHTYSGYLQLCTPYTPYL